MAAAEPLHGVPASTSTAQPKTSPQPIAWAGAWR
jgi:hypothetical protein